MKVTNNSVGTNILNVKPSKQTGQDDSYAKKSLEVEGGAKGSVKLNLSDHAQAFQKAKEIASKIDVNEAKVARLQKLIDEGKYSVDASAIADRLVDEHLSISE